MKTKHKKLVASLIIGLIAFLILNHLEGKCFYGNSHDYSSHMINVYFYPLLIIADLINLVIPISMSSAYLQIVEPVHNNPITLTIGILYTSLLSYAYLSLISLKFFKKIPKVLKPTVFLLLLITLLTILLYLSTLLINSGIIHPDLHVRRYMGP